MLKSHYKSLDVDSGDTLVVDSEVARRKRTSARSIWVAFEVSLVLAMIAVFAVLGAVAARHPEPAQEASGGRFAAAADANRGSYKTSGGANNSELSPFTGNTSDLNPEVPLPVAKQLPQWQTDEALMDIYTKPSSPACSDFFTNRCGGGIAPEGSGISGIAAAKEQQLADRVAHLAQLAGNEQLQAMWNSCMRPGTSVEPLMYDLMQIRAISNAQQLASVNAKLNRMGGVGLLDINPILFNAVQQASLQLAPADFNDTYVDAVTQALFSFGYPITSSAALEGVAVVGYFTKIRGALAAASGSDAMASFSSSQLAAAAPAVPWTSMFARLQMTKGVFVSTARTLNALEMLLGAAASAHKLTMDELRAGLRMQLLASAMPMLPLSVQQTWQTLFASPQFGELPVLPERKLVCTNILQQTMADLLGEQYVAHYVPPQSVASVKKIYANVLAATIKQVTQSSWLDSAMADQYRSALNDLMPLSPEAPEQLRSRYAGISIGNDTAYANWVTLNNIAYLDGVTVLGKTIRAKSWMGVSPLSLTPSIHRGYAFIPAGSFAVFAWDAPPAYNYGAIGVDLAVMLASFLLRAPEDMGFSAAQQATYTTKLNCFENELDGMPAYGYSSADMLNVFAGNVTVGVSTAVRLAQLSAGINAAYTAMMDNLPAAEQNGQHFFSAAAFQECSLLPVIAVMNSLSTPMNIPGFVVNALARTNSHFHTDFSCGAATPIGSSNTCPVWT